MDKMVKAKQYKRKETYWELKSDMIALYGEEMWEMMARFIHSPLVRKKK